MIVYHFAEREGLRDGSPLPVKGTTVVFDTSLSIYGPSGEGCQHIVDALRYGTGPMLCKAELSGKMLSGDLNAISATRTNLTEYVDVSPQLHTFATWCRLRENQFLSEWFCCGRAEGAWVAEETWECLRATYLYLVGKIDRAALETSTDGADVFAQFNACIDDSTEWAMRNPTQVAYYAAAWPRKSPIFHHNDAERTAQDSYLISLLEPLLVE